MRLLLLIVCIAAVNTRLIVEKGNAIKNLSKLGQLFKSRVKRDWSYPPVTVSENSRISDPILTIESDKPGEIVYTLGNAPVPLPSGVDVGTYFEMKNSEGSGLLMLKSGKTLDREEYAEWNVQVFANFKAGGEAESPLTVVIKVSDVDDNAPVLVSDSRNQKFAESRVVDDMVFALQWTDADDPNVGANAVAIFEKKTETVGGEMTDYLRVAEDGSVYLKTPVDYELVKNIKLEVNIGSNNVVNTKNSYTVQVEVIDSNDNSPTFLDIKEPQPLGVEETKQVGTTVLQLKATDVDDAPQNHRVYFNITDGDPANEWRLESIPSDSGNSAANLIINRKLDYETGATKYTLKVTAFNIIDGKMDLEHMTIMPVLITVVDMNEPPVFDNDNYKGQVTENSVVGTYVMEITAFDYDYDQSQKITYSLDENPEEGFDWFQIDSQTGIITVLNPPDREKLDDTMNKYDPNQRETTFDLKVYATDDYVSPNARNNMIVAIEILDVDDNSPKLAPFPDDTNTITICRKDRTTRNVSRLTAYDYDTAASSLPLTMDFHEQSSGVVNAGQWYLEKINDVSSDLLLDMSREYPTNTANLELVIKVSDKSGLSSTSTITVSVCECGEENDPNKCKGAIAAGGFLIPVIIVIIVIAILIIIILAIVVYKRKQAADDAKGGLLYEDEDDVRENLQVYHDEGGGEEDQDAYDITALQQPLEEPRGPRVIDMKPVGSEHPQPRIPRNIPGDDIEKYIDDAKAQADKDPTAPPFDSLLVFDYEGTGSDAGSLSSLNSGTTDGSQDYQYLNDWGPRFENLADMYGQGSDSED